MYIFNVWRYCEAAVSQHDGFLSIAICSIISRAEQSMMRILLFLLGRLPISDFRQKPPNLLYVQLPEH